MSTFNGRKSVYVRYFKPNDAGLNSAKQEKAFQQTQYIKKPTVIRQHCLGHHETEMLPVIVESS